MTGRALSVADARLDYGRRYRAYCRNLPELEAFVALVGADPTATDAEMVEVAGKRGGDRLPLGAWRAALASMRAGQGNPTRWKKRPFGEALATSERRMR